MPNNIAGRYVRGDASVTLVMCDNGMCVVTLCPSHDIDVQILFEEPSYALDSYADEIAHINKLMEDEHA